MTGEGKAGIIDDGFLDRAGHHRLTDIALTVGNRRIQRFQHIGTVGTIKLARNGGFCQQHWNYAQLAGLQWFSGCTGLAKLKAKAELSSTLL